MNYINESFDFDNIDSSDIKEDISIRKAKNKINQYLDYAVKEASKHYLLYRKILDGNRLMLKLLTSYFPNILFFTEYNRDLSRISSPKIVVFDDTTNEELFKVYQDISLNILIKSVLSGMIRWIAKKETGKTFQEIFNQESYNYLIDNNILEKIIKGVNESFEFDSDKSEELEDYKKEINKARTKTLVNQYVDYAYNIGNKAYRDYNLNYASPKLRKENKMNMALGLLKFFNLNSKIEEDSLRPGSKTYTLLKVYDGTEHIFSVQYGESYQRVLKNIIEKVIKWVALKESGIDFNKLYGETYDKWKRKNKKILYIDTFRDISESIRYDNGLDIDNNPQEDFSKEVSYAKALVEINEVKEILKEEYDYEIDTYRKIQPFGKSSYLNVILDFLSADLGISYEVVNADKKVNYGRGFSDIESTSTLVLSTDYKDTFMNNYHEEFDLEELYQEDYKPLAEFYLEALFFKLTGVAYSKAFPNKPILEKRSLLEAFDFKEDREEISEVKNRIEKIKLIQKALKVFDEETPDYALQIFTKFLNSLNLVQKYNAGTNWVYHILLNKKLIYSTEDVASIFDIGSRTYNNGSLLYLAKIIGEAIINDPTLDYTELIHNPVSLLNEGLPFGDPMGAGNSEGIQNNGDPFCEYKLMPLVSNLSQKTKHINLEERVISKGDFVSGISPIDNKEHSGYVYRILKNPDATIQWVYILAKETREFIRLDPETIDLDSPIPVLKKEMKDPFKSFRRGSFMEGGTTIPT